MVVLSFVIKHFIPNHKGQIHKEKKDRNTNS